MSRRALAVAVVLAVTLLLVLVGISSILAPVPRTASAANVQASSDTPLSTSDVSAAGLTMHRAYDVEPSPGSPPSSAAPLAVTPSRWTCTPPVIDGLAPFVEWGTAPGVGLPNGKMSFLNDGSFLYILIDLARDTGDDQPSPTGAPQDFFFLTFDVNLDAKITPRVDINYALFAGTFNLAKQFYTAPSEWTFPVSTTSQLGAGFAPSPLTTTPHRIWEFAIDEKEISTRPGDLVRIGVRTFSPKPSFDDRVPPNFENDFTNLIEVRLAPGPCSVQLAKRGTPGFVRPGDILNYEVEYTLGGTAVYSDVVISDPLPPGVILLPAAYSPTVSYSGGVVKASLGNLPGGTNGVVAFQALVTRDACRAQRVIVDQAQMTTASPSLQVVSNQVVTEFACPPIDFPTNNPPYAESEITVEPYPLVTGQLTKLCTTIHNNTGLTQTVNVEFDLAIFGIGQPFTAIAAPGNPRTVTIPPGGTVTVCIFWRPTVAGHQCVQVVVTGGITAQFTIRSQRNLDVNEVLTPGQRTTFTVPVRNDGDATASFAMVVRNTCGWMVTVSPTTFTLVPAEQKNVVVTVTPPTGAMLGTKCTLDIEAWQLNAQTGARLRLVGGIRKIDQPQVPLGRPDDPPYAEREIRINPYPLVSGVPTEVCVTISNNTDVTKTVTADFRLSTFGIGLVFNRIPSISGPNPQTVVIPPHTSITMCIKFIPSTPGHHCMQVVLTSPDGYSTASYQNLDIAERLVPGRPTDTIIPVANPTGANADIDLVVDNTCPGWIAFVTPSVLLAVGPNSSEIRNVILTVIPPVGPLGSGCHIDLKAYINGVLIGGVRKIDRPPVDVPTEPHFAEREITVNPDPPVVGESTQLCVTLTNPTNVDQTVNVTFAAADFGAGIPFTPIQTVNNVVIPANGSITRCITWTPGTGGTLHRCVRVQVSQAGYRDVYSQRNLNVRRLRPVPVFPIDLPTFSVRNPLSNTANIQFDLRVVGLRVYMPPFPGIPVDLFDAQSMKMINWGDAVMFGPNEVRQFFVRLGMPAGPYEVQEATQLPFMAGDKGVIDVVPFVEGQPIVVDGVESGVEFEVDAPASAWLPLIMR